MTDSAMLALIRREVARLGGIRASAREWGLSHSYLARVLSGQQPTGPRLLAKVGWERATTLRRIKGRGK